MREAGVARFEIFSGATGASIARHGAPGLDLITGNGEPFLGIADADGDGKRELAIGGVFEGRVAIYSTATGALLREWTCDTPPHACFGSRLIEVGDWNANARPDLLALESEVFGSGGLRIFGLDPAKKRALLFDQLMPGLSGGYSNSDRIAALPGADRLGSPTFAIFSEALSQVTVRRFVPTFLAR